MRNAKRVLMATLVAGSALLVGATPRPAAAEVAAVVQAAIPDGTYDVYENGIYIGTITIIGGKIVSNYPAS